MISSVWNPRLKRLWIVYCFFLSKFPFWKDFQYFMVSLSGIPLWKDSEYFRFSQSELVERILNNLLFSLWEIPSEKTLNIFCVSFWNSNLKRLWTFLFTLFEFLSENTLNISWFSQSKVPTWKDFENFIIFLIWNPCLKTLWILHDFPCLKSPSEKTLNSLLFFSV